MLAGSSQQIFRFGVAIEPEAARKYLGEKGWRIVVRRVSFPTFDMNDSL